MITKSIRLTPEEAGELRQYVAATGEVEASALKRAALRGLREMRLEQGILAYLKRGDSAEAAEIAGLPRAHFLQELIDRGLTLDWREPEEMRQSLGFLAEKLGLPTLRDAAARAGVAR